MCVTCKLFMEFTLQKTGESSVGGFKVQVPHLQVGHTHTHTHTHTHIYV
jgi:hypothetical protein